MASDDYGRDLTGVQNLLKKHKRLEAELASHEPAVQAVQEAGEKLKVNKRKPFFFSSWRGLYCAP